MCVETSSLDHLQSVGRDPSLLAYPFGLNKTVKGTLFMRVVPVQVRSSLYSDEHLDPSLYVSSYRNTS